MIEEQTVTFLKEECDRLLALYTQAQGNVQNVFNFYLTFITAIVGGVVFLLQAEVATGVLILLLFFSAVVGTVYLSALSGRYAHAARYAYAVDQIRRYLIQQMNLQVPPFYEPFMTKPMVTTTPGWVYWLVPTGTYQMFVALVNSTALALMTALIFSVGDVSGGRVFFAALLVFIITLTLFNAYSRLMIARFGSQGFVEIWHMPSMWAGKEF